jgi:hypothetical protein
LKAKCAELKEEDHMKIFKAGEERSEKEFWNL